MAARLRAPRLLVLLAVLAAASVIAVAPASAQTPAYCGDGSVATDLYSDGAYEWSFNGYVFDQTRYRTLCLDRNVPFTLSVAADLGNGRTFTGWTGKGVDFSDSSAATATVTVHGDADTLNGGYDALISAHYSAPVSSGVDWSWLLPWNW